MYRPVLHRTSQPFSVHLSSLIAATILATVILFASASTAQIAIETPFEQTGLSPAVTIAADMNQDGIPDIVSANGCPGYGQYRPDPAGGHRPWALQVLEISGDRIAEMHFFLDAENLFPIFGLPAHLPA